MDGRPDGRRKGGTRGDLKCNRVGTMQAETISGSGMKGNQAAESDLSFCRSIGCLMQPPPAAIYSTRENYLTVGRRKCYLVSHSPTGGKRRLGERKSCDKQSVTTGLCSDTLEIQTRLSTRKKLTSQADISRSGPSLTMGVRQWLLSCKVKAPFRIWKQIGK